MTGADKKKRNAKKQKLTNEDRLDDMSFMNDIRQVVELQTGTKHVNDGTGKKLQKLYRNDKMKARIANARDKLIERKKREVDANEEFPGVKNKFKKFTNKKKGGKKAGGKKGGKR